MNTATTRLMWKEFRAQRDLWLAILIGFAAVQAIMLYSFTGHGDGAQIPVLQIVGTLSLIGSLSFGLAAVAVGFAGEVDERTVRLLRMLPCSTTNLIFSKLATTLCGVILLTVALVLVACGEVLCLQFSHWMWPQTIGALPYFFIADFPVKLIEKLVSFGVLMGGTSLTASMLTRRVTSAAAGGIVAAILTIWILSVPFHGPSSAFSLDTPSSAFEICQIIIGSALLAVAYFGIAPRWHRGLLPIPEQIHKDAALPRATTAKRRFLLRVSLPRFSIKQLFHRIAARPESSGRQTAMLAVQALSLALPTAVRWLAVSVVLFVAGCLLSSSLFPIPMILLVFFIHECGQKTFREDQRTGAFLMLSHIGVSPLRIWLVRTTVWFSMMLAVTVVFVTLDALVPGLRRSVWQSQTTSLQTILGGIMHLVRLSGSQTAATSMGIGICMGGILAVFGSGQLMACWIQRQLLAFAGSWLLLGLFYSLGIIVIADLGWSVWWTLVPVSVGLYLATAATARYWMDRRITWRLRSYQAAWIIGPILLFGMLAREHWYYVPGINPLRSYLPNHSPMFRGDLLPSLKWLRRDPDLEPWTRVAERLVKVNSSISPRPNLDANSRDFNLRFAAGLSREQFKPVVENLERLDELPFSQTALPVRWMAPWTNSPAPVVVCILLEDARLLQDAGDGAGALRQLVRAARFGRRLSYQTSSWEGWKTCLRFERLALGRLMVVLGEVDLSTADLSKLIDDLQPQNDSTSSIEDMLRHREAFFAVAATQEGRRMIGQQVSEEPWVNAAFAGFKPVHPRKGREFGMLSHLSDAKGLRAWKVMLLSSEYLRSSALCRLNYFIANPAHFYYSFLDHPAAFDFRPMIPEQIQDYARGAWIGDELDDFMVTEKAYTLMDTIALERAAVLSIRLHQFRLEHGNFPKYLWELPSVSQPYDDNPQTVRSVDHLDPWTGTLFAYAPQGIGTGFPLDRSLTTGRTTASVRAQQPILISQTTMHRQAIGEVATEAVAALPEASIVLCGLSEPPEWLKWSPSPDPVKALPDGQGRGHINK